MFMVEDLRRDSKVEVESLSDALFAAILGDQVTGAEVELYSDFNVGESLITYHEGVPVLFVERKAA